MKNNKTTFELESVLEEEPNGVNLCICNNCMTIFIDQESQVGAKVYNTDNIEVEEMQYEDGAWICPVCDTDDYLMEL